MYTFGLSPGFHLRKLHLLIQKDEPTSMGEKQAILKLRKEWETLTTIVQASSTMYNQTGIHKKYRNE